MERSHHNVVIALHWGISAIRAAADVLQGRELAPGVRLTVTPSSLEVSKRAESEGLLTVPQSSVP